MLNLFKAFLMGITACLIPFAWLMLGVIGIETAIGLSFEQSDELAELAGGALGGALTMIGIWWVGHRILMTWNDWSESTWNAVKLITIGTYATVVIVVNPFYIGAAVIGGALAWGGYSLFGSGTEKPLWKKICGVMLMLWGLGGMASPFFNVY